MKKYWFLWLFAFFIVGLFFLRFLDDVEENGKEYALLEYFKIVIWAIALFIGLICSAGYWLGIGKLLEKLFPNMPEWANKPICVIMMAIYIWLIFLYIDGAKVFTDWYDSYQYQKKMEYRGR